MIRIVPYITFRAIISLRNIGLRREVGGAGIYLKENISFIKRDDLILPECEFESAFIEIDQDVFRKNRKLIISRSSDKDVKSFNTNMKYLLANLKNENKNCYFMCDSNINLWNYENTLLLLIMLIYYMQTHLYPCWTDPQGLIMNLSLLLMMYLPMPLRIKKTHPNV